MIRISVFIEAMNMLPNPQLFRTLAGYKGRAVGRKYISCIDILIAVNLILSQFLGA